MTRYTPGLYQNRSLLAQETFQFTILIFNFAWTLSTSIITPTIGSLQLNKFGTYNKCNALYLFVRESYIIIMWLSKKINFPFLTNIPLIAYQHLKFWSELPLLLLMRKYFEVAAHFFQVLSAEYIWVLYLHGS